MHKSVERVTGMKKFKGDIDGKQFDSTTVYIETKMDDRNGTRRGRCSMDFSAGNSGVYDRLAAISLPGEFDVEWDTVTNGSKTQQIIVDIRPKAAAPVKPAAPV
ncbi:MAG: hypothetical protein M0Q22_04465 [Sulfuritalea sp.]|jgi:hypothetical protein|nr:hypothetical protein [Sulfuritalea sp.]